MDYRVFGLIDDTVAVRVFSISCHPLFGFDFVRVVRSVYASGLPPWVTIPHTHCRSMIHCRRR